jgi:hypothetical protein
MNELHKNAFIADFQVTRSSLEHVFIHFAKFQLGTGMAIQPTMLPVQAQMMPTVVNTQ